VNVLDTCCVSVLVTTTLCAPADPVGVLQVICVWPVRTTLEQLVPPTVTVAPLRKPVPVIVIEVPPRIGPDEGEIELIVGIAS
jgi:hypothetical protein